MQLPRAFSPPRQNLPVPLLGIWLALLTLRAVALFIGLDRLPLVPAAPPEVMINDPAIALSRGFGLAAFSFEHSLNHLNILYANFPPVYIGLQALLFSVLGFSVATLRVPGVLADLAATGTFLLVLRELYERKIVDRLGVALGGILLLLEPITLIHNRSGRMESVCMLFGSLSLYLCVRSDRGNRRQTLLLCAGALAAGLALATHFESLAICAVLTVWSVPLIGRLRFGWVALNALPLVVLMTVWLIAYGAKSAEAFHQLRQLAIYAPKSSLGLGDVIASALGGAPRQALQSGAPAIALILAAVLLGSGRILTAAKQGAAEGQPAEWRSSLVRFTAIVFVQCALIQFIIPGPGTTRLIVIIPYAVICLALALSGLGAATGKLAKIAVALMALIQVAVTGVYLAELRHSWAGRSPQRFDNLVSAIPADARVVAVPEFWYAFQSHNRRLALIYHADDEFKYWSDSPDAFDPYDVVILDPTTPEYKSLHEKAKAGRPVEYVLRTYGRDFTVDARTLNMAALTDSRPE